MILMNVHQMVDWAPAVTFARTQLAGTIASAPLGIILALIPITVLPMIVVILLLC